MNLVSLNRVYLMKGTIDMDLAVIISHHHHL